MSEEARGPGSQVIWVEVEARLPRRVVQEVEVQAGRAELGRGRDGGGHPMAKKKEEELGRVLRVQTLSQYGTIRTLQQKEEGKKGKEGEWWAQALGLTRSVVIRSITGSRCASTPARVTVVVFESRMLTMG